MREEIEELRKELDTTKGCMAGLLIAVTALIQTHPNHRKVNLVLSELLDQQKSGGAIWKALTPHQRVAAESIGSLLQQIGQVKLKMDPPAYSKRPPD